MSLIAFGESAKLVEQLTTDSGGLGLNPSLVHRIFSLPITHANMVLHEECLESDLTNQNVMLNTTIVLINQPIGGDATFISALISQQYNTFSC